MKLALASLIAFLAAYLLGGSLIDSPTAREGEAPRGDRAGQSGGGLASAVPAGNGASPGTAGLTAERSFFASLAGADPDALEALYRSVRHDPHRVNLVAQHWAELDPAGMFAALSSGAVDEHQLALSHLFFAWASSDPVAAMAAARQVGRSGPGYFDPVGRVVGGMLESNPEAAIEFISDNPDEVRSLGMPSWAFEDPVKALQILAPVLHTDRFRNGLDALARSLLRRDQSAAFAWAEEIDWRSRARVQFVIGRTALDGGDLPAALAMIQSPSFNRTELAGELAVDYAAKLAQEKPAEALAWAVENLSGTQRTNAISRSIDDLVAVDLPAALRFYDQLPPGRIGESVADHLARAWGKTDRRAAIGWVTEIGGDAQERALRGIALSWLGDDPEGALDYAAQHPEVQGTFYQQHINELCRKDEHRSALEWIARLPDSVDRQEIATDALGSWTYDNPAAAAEYVESLPAGERERGIATVAGRYFSVSEKRALDWVRSLPAEDRAHVVAEVKERVRDDPRRQRLLEAIAEIGNP